MGCLNLNQGKFFHLSVIEGRPDVTKIQRVVCLCPRYCVFISLVRQRGGRDSLRGSARRRRRVEGDEAGKNILIFFLL